MQTLLASHHVDDAHFFDDDFYALQRGHLTPNKFLTEKSMQLNLDRSTLHDAFAAMIETTTINALSSLTLPYLFMSNINAMHFEIFCRGKNISSFAKQYSLLSYQVGYLKPDSRFFKKLAPSIARMATEALYIDDRHDNLQRAAQFGFRTAHCASCEHLPHVLRAHHLI